LTKIAALEQDLLGDKPAKHKSIAACIESVIARDRPFTTVDIATALEALDSSREWRARSINSHISRLRDKGILKRLKRSRNLEPAQYAVADLETEPLPFQGLTMPDVIESLLRDSE